MKRFVETTRWDDPWYRQLSPLAKNLWNWLTDKCNCIGLVDLDLAAASFGIGGRITEKHVAELETRMQRLENGKFFITKFIPFQYGELSTGCPAHKPVFRAIALHQIVRVLVGYQYPTARVHDTYRNQIGKGKEPEPEWIEPENPYHKDARTVLHLLNEASGKHFREVDKNLGFVSARLKEPGVTLEGVRQMIERQCKRWNKTKDAEYLRPETLFNETKFDAYYAAKDQPIYENTKANNPRLDGVYRGGTNYGEAAKRKLERQVDQTENRTPSEVKGDGT